ncbi:MAG: PIG-L deacetylase family protein [Thermoplasmata archaeon]
MIGDKSLLMLSPHTDDGELAAGGTMARFIDEDWDVYYVAFSSCEKSIPRGDPEDILKTECKKATEILGIPRANLFLLDYEVRSFPSERQDILDKMIEIEKEIKPHLVFVPSSNDTHQDHQTIFWEALRAFKKASSIWGFENPWNNLNFTTDIFVRLEKEHIERKIRALKEYHSQDSKSYFKDDYIMASARMRGTQVDYRFAETFELLRMLVG